MFETEFCRPFNKHNKDWFIYITCIDHIEEAIFFFPLLVREKAGKMIVLKWYVRKLSWTLIHSNTYKACTMCSFILCEREREQEREGEINHQSMYISST